MNPPSRRPDDQDLPPLPPRPGEAARPAGDTTPASAPDGRDPFLDQPLPTAEPVSRPAGRDPLLDDPLFAELVNSPPGPDLSLTEPPPAGPAPLVAEPVPEEADLPVAQPVRRATEPEVLDAEPVAELVDEPVPVARPPAPPAGPPHRPRAHPVTPAPFPHGRPRAASSAPAAARSVSGPAADTDLPKSRPLAACGVIGCVAVVVVGALAFLAFVAVTVLGHLGDRLAEQSRGHGAGGADLGRPDPVAPTTLTKNTTLTLPGRFDAVGRGAGGRYLLLRIPSRKELAVFDPNTGGLIKSFPTEEPDALFAAGAAKLFVYKKKARTIERYDLLGGTVEQTAPVPADAHGVDAITVGARSDGPVYLLSAGAGGRPGEVRVLDGADLKPAATHRVERWAGPADGRVHARASDAGTVVGVAGDPGAVVLSFTGDGCRAVSLRAEDDAPPRLATPSPDGKYVYTPRGVFQREGTRIARPDTDYFYTFPAAHGSALYLSLDVGPGGRFQDRPPRLHFPGTSRQTVGLLPVTVPAGLNADDAGDVPPDQRIHLWPAAGLAAVLPVSNDKIELYKVDVEAALRRGGTKYLVIASDPPTAAARGAEWVYRPVIWASDPQRVRLKIEGPPGMHLRDGGREIAWTPPRGAEGPVTVVVRADQETPWREVTDHTEQTFQLAVVDPAER